MDERAQVQMERELGRLFQLNHSNVVKVLGGSNVSTPPFIVYEDTTDGNLGCFLARSDSNKKKMWTMLHGAALGLDYLHKKGFVHGHLKLSNILVGADGQAKLADFGLDAMRRYLTLSKKFSSAVVQDDLRWRAPEYLEKGPTPASDVYSFAMCIIEAVAGEVPFALVDPSRVWGVTPNQPGEMNEEEWELVLAMIDEDPSNRIELNEVIGKLKHFAAKAVSKVPHGQICAFCSSLVYAGSRFCSQCGTQLQPGTTDRPDLSVGLVNSDSISDIAIPEPIADVTSDQSTSILDLPSSVNVSEDTSIPELIATSSTILTPETQEQVVLLLFLASMDPEKRKTIYEADGAPALIQLIKNGLSHFTQLCSLRCLCNLKGVASGLKDTAWDELSGVIRATTQEECRSVSTTLQDGDDEATLKAVAYCACIAAAGGHEALYTAAAIPPIVTLLELGNDNEKILAANALGHIGEDERNCDLITRKGAVATLVAQLQRGSAVQIEQSSWALRRLSKYSACSKTDAALSAVPTLVRLLRAGAGTQRLYSVWTLGNLAFDNGANRTAIVSAGAIPDFLELLGTGTAELRDHAIRALANLTISWAYRASITTQATLPLFSTLLKDGSAAEKTHSVRILTNSTVDGGVRDMLTSAVKDITPPLIALLHEGTGQQKACAAQLLANLSLDRRARDYIVERGAVGHCVALLRAGSDSQNECAACLLANVAIDSENRHVIASTAVLPPLVALLRSGNVGQKSHAVRALANLAANHERTQVIADAGAVAPLVAILREGNEKQKVNAVGVLAYLATSAILRSAIANAGAIPAFVEILRTGSGETTAQAAFVLGQLAITSAANHAEIVERGGRTLLEKLQQTGSGSQKRRAEAALRILGDKDRSKRRRFGDLD